MKRTISVVVGITIILLSGTVAGQAKHRMTSANYMPAVALLEQNAKIYQWYSQYSKTTSSKPSIENFLQRLSTSEVLVERSKRAGLSHNQLFSPIITLMEKNWSGIDEMDSSEIATIRLSLLELDIALAAIEATLPNSAHEEFRREVLRGAKPLSEVAKLPSSAVEAMQKMTFTEKEHIVTDRINNPTIKTRNPPIQQDILKSNEPDLKSQYMPW